MVQAFQKEPVSEGKALRTSPTRRVRKKATTKFIFGTQAGPKQTYFGSKRLPKNEAKKDRKKSEKELPRTSIFLSLFGRTPPPLEQYLKQYLKQYIIPEHLDLTRPCTLKRAADSELCTTKHDQKWVRKVHAERSAPKGPCRKVRTVEFSDW